MAERESATLGLLSLANASIAKFVVRMYPQMIGLDKLILYCGQNLINMNKSAKLSFTYAYLLTIYIIKFITHKDGCGWGVV